MGNLIAETCRGTVENELSKLKKKLRKVQKTNRELWEENTKLRKELYEIKNGRGRMGG